MRSKCREIKKKREINWRRDKGETLWGCLDSFHSVTGCKNAFNILNLPTSNHIKLQIRPTSYTSTFDGLKVVVLKDGKWMFREEKKKFRDFHRLRREVSTKTGANDHPGRAEMLSENS